MKLKDRTLRLHQHTVGSEVGRAAVPPDPDNLAFERSGRDAAIPDARSGDNIHDSTQRIRWGPELLHVHATALWIATGYTTKSINPQIIVMILYLHNGGKSPKLNQSFQF